MDLRYAVLHHQGIAEPHFDLMIEKSPGGPLATWRVPVWPPRPDTVARQVPDHRAEYLTYEGQVSGARGAVQRIEAGTYQHSANKFGIQVYLLAPSGLKIMMRNTTDETWAIWPVEISP